MSDPALYVALAALAFTLYSFWWLQARKGRVRGFSPPSYAAHPSRLQSDSLVVRLPVVLYNSGARTRVVHEVRLRIQGDYLRWGSFRKTLDPRPDDVEDMPIPYLIGGRLAECKFIEFVGSITDVLPQPKGYQASLEVRLDGSGDWEQVTEFDLRFWHMTDPGSYVALSNSDTPCEPDEREQARRAIRAFAAKKRIDLPWA